MRWRWRKWTGRIQINRFLSWVHNAICIIYSYVGIKFVFWNRLNWNELCNLHARTELKLLKVRKIETVHSTAVKRECADLQVETRLNLSLQKWISQDAGNSASFQEIRTVECGDGMTRLGRKDNVEIHIRTLQLLLGWRMLSLFCPFSSSPELPNNEIIILWTEGSKIQIADSLWKLAWPGRKRDGDMTRSAERRWWSDGGKSMEGKRKRSDINSPRELRCVLEKARWIYVLIYMQLQKLGEQWWCQMSGLTTFHLLLEHECAHTHTHSRTSWRKWLENFTLTKPTIIYDRKVKLVCQFFVTSHYWFSHTLFNTLYQYSVPSSSKSFTTTYFEFWVG